VALNQAAATTQFTHFGILKKARAQRSVSFLMAMNQTLSSGKSV